MTTPEETGSVSIDSRPLTNEGRLAIMKKFDGHDIMIDDHGNGVIEIVHADGCKRCPESILAQLGLGTEYSPESVAKISSELARLEPKIIEAKAERIRIQREFKNQWEDLIAARVLLYSNRTPRPGDVVIK